MCILLCSVVVCHLYVVCVWCYVCHVICMAYLCYVYVMYVWFYVCVILCARYVNTINVMCVWCSEVSRYMHGGYISFVCSVCMLLCGVLHDDCMLLGGIYMVL